jgi:uncharacterized Zn-binding protein involved in type VI secretion
MLIGLNSLLLTLPIKSSYWSWPIAIDQAPSLTVAVQPIGGATMDTRSLLFEEETRRYLAECAAASAYRPVKKLQAAVTIGSRTQRGGEVVTASTEIEVIVGDKRLRVACVGDIVRYPDGSESTISSGAGVAVCYKGRPIAVVGSDLANGDVITESLQASYQITHHEPEPAIAALL